MNYKIYKNIKLYTDGMGIVIYSNKAMNYVNEGDDFLQKNFLLLKMFQNILKKEI